MAARTWPRPASFVRLRRAACPVGSCNPGMMSKCLVQKRRYGMPSWSKAAFAFFQLEMQGGIFQSFWSSNSASDSGTTPNTKPSKPRNAHFLGGQLAWRRVMNWWWRRRRSTRNLGDSWQVVYARLCEAAGPAGLLVLELRRSEWIHWSFHELDDTLLSKARRTKDFPLSSVGLLGGGARQLGV